MQVIASTREELREELYHEDLEIQEWQGVGQGRVEGASGYPKSTGLYSKRPVNRERIAQDFCEGSARAEKLNEA